MLSAPHRLAPQIAAINATMTKAMALKARMELLRKEMAYVMAELERPLPLEKGNA
jgi:hypothetical protein